MLLASEGYPNKVTLRQHLAHALSWFRETRIGGLADLLIDLSMYQHMRGLNNKSPFRSLQTYSYIQMHSDRSGYQAATAV